MKRAADEERLRSWALEIAATLLPGVPWRDEGDERRFFGQGGLSINRRRGCWYRHAAGVGGWSAVALIRHLKNCSPQEAEGWAATWLASHSGLGECDGGPEEDDQHPASAPQAKDILARAVDVTGTPGGAYLRRRGITGPPPDCVRFLPDARIGEGALVGVLSSHGRIVGVQITYLDPDGQKSTIQPVRRRFALEPAPGAVFELKAPADHQITVIAEGLEDALSIAAADRPVRIIGLPGIGALSRLTVRKGEDVVVFRDGDEPGSAADKSLIEGIDHLLLEGARVCVTETPTGEDANSLLIENGISAIAECIQTARPATLSADGELRRLARLDPLDYELTRREAAKQLGIRNEVLDAEVRRRRNCLKTEGDPAPQIGEDPDLLDETVDLTQTLDDILAEVRRYVVAPDTLLGTTALWCAHAHLCHHDKIRLQRSPRLAIQARTPAAGKTTLLEIVAVLTPHPLYSSSLTAATILRIVDAIKPTLLIDEADRVLRDLFSDMVAILNAGDRRNTAKVHRSVPLPDGGWEPHEFDVFGAVAFAGIGELPSTLQDRSIIIPLQKALGTDIRDHLEDGESPELLLLRRKLATWSVSLRELPRPEMPEVLRRQAGRAGDNWRVLFAIAQLAGGRWPDLVEQAALETVGRESKHTRVERLLASIWRAFHRLLDAETLGENPQPYERLISQELLDFLLGDSEETWSRADRGQPISIYWLRDNLRQLLDPPRTQQWRDENHKRCRGYLRRQFVRSWEVHRSSELADEAVPVSAESRSQSGARGASEHATDNVVLSAGQNSPVAPHACGPDASEASVGTIAVVAAPHASGADAGICPANNLGNSIAYEHAPDAPDRSEGSGLIETSAGVSGPRRDRRAEAIVDVWEANPTRGASWVAEQLGQPLTVIRDVLGDRIAKREGITGPGLSA